MKKNTAFPMTINQIIMILLNKIFSRLFIRVTSFLARFQLKLWGAHLGKKLRVDGKLRINSRGKIIIGNNVTINSGPIHVGGSERRTAFRIGKSGVFTMKDGSGMSNSTISCFKEITIGERTIIGGGCEIMDTDFHEINPLDRANKIGNIHCAPIVIGDDVFIGGLSTIKRGVTIGKGSLIGTGSLVIKNIPAHEIWGGVPAKFIKKMETPKDIEKNR